MAIECCEPKLPPVDQHNEFLQQLRVITAQDIAAMTDMAKVEAMLIVASERLRETMDSSRDLSKRLAALSKLPGNEAAMSKLSAELALLPGESKQLRQALQWLKDRFHVLEDAAQKAA